MAAKKYNEDTDTWGVKFYEATSNKATTYDEGTLYKVVKGQKLILPPHKDIDGLTFMGWLEGTTLNMPDCEMRDDELLTLSEGGMEMTPQSDKIYYARYRCQYDAEWTWNGDGKGVKTATVTVKWRNGDETLTDLSADVYNYTVEPTEKAREGKYHYSATAVWQKKDGVQYQFTDQIEIPYVYSVTLEDNASNESVLANNEGNLVRFLTLQGRTLYKDGDWNTICLPFDVTLSGSPLAGATARTLTSASITGTTLTLTFGDPVSTLVAGTPYIIKWTADANYVDDDAHNIVNPVFGGVTIDATDRSFTSGSGDTQVRFLGTYKSNTFDGVDKSILFLGANNTLHYPESGASIGAFRAYFKIGDGDALARQITAFNLEFGDSSESTGIREIDTDPAPSPSPTGVGRSAWYSLDGRKLDGKPTKSGVYIREGKKVVIK